MVRESNGVDPRDNGNGPTILALEIEPGDEDEEQESLLRETMDMDDGVRDGIMKDKLFIGTSSSGIRHRSVDHNGGNNAGYGGTLDRGTAYIRGFLRSDLMSHAVYHLRNFLILGVLAFFVLMIIEWEGGILRDEQMEEVEPPHQFGYGGKKNMGHNVDKNPKKPKNFDNMTPEEQKQALHDQILEEEAANVGPWDLAIQNIMNENANFLHDPNLSPFASELYAEEQDVLDKRQAIFNKKMSDIKDEFGVWNNPNFENARNYEFYDNYDYRDVPINEFPQEVWQKDKDYVQRFLFEASALVEAVKEGIMAEYNHPNPDELEKDLFGVIIGDHDVEDGTAVHTETREKRAGVAYLPQSGWDGLIRKLLHAMVTTDYFYVTCVGRADTYKANNFWRTQVMQFNHIMEPVFHKLGMTLISRNMGMGASTVFSALGGADIYGETDILWHFQSHDEEERTGEFDLLQKQSILAGERVPLILSPVSDELLKHSKGKAWVGNLQPGADMCQETTVQVLPEAPACHHVRCDEQSNNQGKCRVYDSVCWVPRDDYNPPQESQNLDAGDQQRNFPGYRKHQLEGRKMALLVLHGLEAALKLWGEQLEDEKNPLPLAEKYWHVKDSYTSVREALMSLDRPLGESVDAPSCEVLMKDIDPRICTLPMHAYTEWTPRANPRTRRLLHIVYNVVLGESDSEQADAYDGPDLLPPQWQIPADQMDVHMIAIAANRTDSYDDDIFGDGWGDDDLYGMNGFDRNLQSEQNDEGNSLHARRSLQAGEASAPGEISEGSGWRVVDSPIGFCDGSAQSRCNRRDSNPCILANHNHYKATLAGNHKNDWLVMRIPALRHGIVLARLEFIPKSGKELPDDLVFEYAVNGDVTSVKRADLDAFGKDVVDFLKVYPLLLDKGYAAVDIYPDGRHCTVAIRIRSESDRECELRISHIYFA